MHCIHRRIYSKNLIVGEGILPLSYINPFLSSAWVDIEKYGHGCVAFVLQQLGACFRHALACERQVDALLELDDNLAYRLRLHTCYGWLVWSEYAVGERLTQTRSHLDGGTVYELLVAVAQIDIDEVVERRIAEHAALLKQVAGERLEVARNDLLYHWQVGTLGLQYDESALVAPSGSATHLREHLKRLLVGTEVGIVEHGVGVEYAHNGNPREVEPLGYHLRADEYVGSAAGEVVDDASVGSCRARGVEVHAGYACFGEQLAHAVLNLLRAVAATEQFGALAVGALLRYGVGVAAVVAGEQVHRAVIGERHVAVLALRHPSAHLALNHRRKAAAVLEQQHLLLVAQSRAHRFE